MTRTIEITTKQDYSSLTRELTANPTWELKTQRGERGTIIATVTEK